MKTPLDFHRIAAQADAKITQVWRTAKVRKALSAIQLTRITVIDSQPKGMFRRIVTRDVNPKLLMIKGPLCDGRKISKQIQRLPR